MELLDRVNSAPLLRPLGIPESLRNVCVIVFNSDLSRLQKLRLDHPWLNIRRLIIPDFEPEQLKNAFLEMEGARIPCLPVTELPFYPWLEKIYLCPADPTLATVALTKLSIFGANFSVHNFYLYGDQPPAMSTREALPDFYHTHAKELDRAINLFADEKSRDFFASRVKAIICGNAAYMPIADHEEYFHPLVQPEKGNVMIDGGVSDMVQRQYEFLEALGADGQIFGFEPIPHMAEKARKALADFPNYHLQVQGLSEGDGRAVFKDLRDSSYMLRAGEEGVDCEMTSIDSFCQKRHIARLDCIKLDVEGAELQALKGAEKAIRSMRPKLIICLYHKPRDMYEIPEYIKRIAPEYRLYLAHSSCQFTDTILYGLPEK